MKKTVFVLVSMLFMSLAGMPAYAIDPVIDPAEGYVITSGTAIETDGNMILDQDYSQEVCNSDGEVIVTVQEDCCDPGDVVFQGPINVNGGFVGYRDQNDARDGMISFRKDFVALGQEDDFNDNVVAVKDVAYETGGPIGYYEADEAGGVSIWQYSGLGIHYDVTNEGGVEEDVTVSVDPNNEKQRHIALGSDMFVTSVSAHTQTGLNLFGNTVSAAHDIGATGVGTVSADLMVRYMEDEEASTVGIMDYAEHTMAAGLFEFGKSMEVSFDIEPAAIHPFDELSPLCPFNFTQANQADGLLF